MDALRHFALTMMFAVAFLCAPMMSVAQEEAEGPEIPAPVVNPEITVQELTLRLVPLTRDELAVAAAAWRDIVKAKTSDVVAAQIVALEGEGDAAAQAAIRAADLAAERKHLFDAYTTVVDSWEKKGGDEAAIAEFRAYRSSIIVEETRSADFQTLLQSALAWAVADDGGLQLARDVAVIVAAIFGLLFVARIVRRVARRFIGSVPNLSKLLQVFIVGTIYWLVMAFGLMIVLSALGVDVSPVFALIGGASFILAFAFQDTLGNLASGLMIMVNRPFDEGDYVDVGGVAGTVKAVSVVATTVTTPDNQVIVIPNKNVWGNVITNVTTSPTRRVDLTFGIGYGDSIAHAQSVLERLVDAHPLILKDPAPVIRVGALGASSVDFIVRPWVRGADYWSVYWDLTRQVKEAFDAEGISIPFPQQDVHMHTVEAKPAPEAVSAPEDATPAAPSDVARNEPGHD